MAEPSRTVIIADVSGSMAEGAKRMVARNVLEYVRQRMRYGSDRPRVGTLHLLAWGGQAVPVTLANDAGIPVFNVGGRAAVQPLLDVLTRTFADGERSRVLLLSDGHFSRADAERLMSWIAASPHVSVRAIAIGADANVAGLKRAIGANGAFAAEDVAWAIDAWPLPPARGLSDSANRTSAAGGNARLP